MTDPWFALSNTPAAPRGSGAGLGAGTLLVELAAVPKGPVVLLDSQGGTAATERFSMLFDSAAGLGVLQRRAGVLRRHWLAGPLPAPAPDGRIAIRFGWDGGRGHWHLAVAPGGVSALDGPAARSARGDRPIPLAPDDAEALCAAAGARDRTLVHPAVDWLGVVARPYTAPPRSGLGPAVPVETPDGPVAAGRLRPGDRVSTLDAGDQPLVAVQRAEVPICGTMAPVLLRAGYLPVRGDIMVGPGQRVLFDGASVEYLFGTEAVLIDAAELCQTVFAMRLRAAGTVPLITLEPARGTLLRSGALTLAVGRAEPASMPALQAYEAAALLASHRRQVPLPR
jgi:hypothetical protein